MHFSEVSSSRNNTDSAFRRRLLMLGAGIAGWSVLSRWKGLVSWLGFKQPDFGALMAFKAGRPEDYPIGEVSSRWLGQYGVWIVRNLEGMYALIANQSSDSVMSWNSKDKKFEGLRSSYYRSGISMKGRRQQAMRRAKIQIQNDGTLQIDPSHTFRHEKGEWNHPHSFLALPSFSGASR